MHTAYIAVNVITCTRPPKPVGSAATSTKNRVGGAPTPLTIALDLRQWTADL
jgi:hypothetical protein